MIYFSDKNTDKNNLFELRMKILLILSGLVQLLVYMSEWSHKMINQ